MSEPRTAAGRALLTDLQKIWPDEVARRILAIEAEAVAWCEHGIPAAFNRPAEPAGAGLREALEAIAADLDDLEHDDHPLIKLSRMREVARAALAAAPVGEEEG